MKRFSRLGLLIFVVYAAMVVVASYHDHQASSDHQNCKLCQFDSLSAHPTQIAKVVSESKDLGFVPDAEIFNVNQEIAWFTFGRAPPPTSI